MMKYTIQWTYNESDKAPEIHYYGLTIRNEDPMLELDALLKEKVYGVTLVVVQP